MATIKKIILLALTALIMVGCSDKKVKYKFSDDHYIVVIDSCEYVKFKFTDGFQHKGNCCFCKERRQKELEELVIKLKEK